MHIVLRKIGDGTLAELREKHPNAFILNMSAISPEDYRGLPGLPSAHLEWKDRITLLDTLHDPDRVIILDELDKMTKQNFDDFCLWLDEERLDHRNIIAVFTSDLTAAGILERVR